MKNMAKKEKYILPVEIIPEDLDIETFVEKWTECKEDIRVIKVVNNEEDADERRTD